MTVLKEANLTALIIKAFYRVYDALGFGLLESVYATALEFELAALGVPFVREAMVNAFYKGRPSGRFRADFVVAEKIIVELKSTTKIDEQDRRQLLNYMRCSTIEVGLLLHFGPKATFQRLVFDNDRKQGLQVIVNG